MIDETTLRLDGFLPFRLSVLSNAVSRQIADIYASEFDLTVWQWRIIAVLGERQGITSTELATRTLMDKPSVSRAAASLIERGVVTRMTDPNDRRRAPLDLTDEGRAIYAAILPRARQCERELLGSLTARETASLHALLTKLAEAVSPDVPLWTDESG